jgi:hypothetical protein
MTPATLRAALATLLAAQLGTYRLPNGTTTPAIYVGNPPSDWVATGLEVIIEPVPDLALSRVHAGVGVGREFRVTLIPRSATTVQAAVERIVRAYETSTPRLVPTNERLGITQQVTLTIRS